MNSYLTRVFEEAKKKNSNEPEFLQAVEEVLELNLKELLPLEFHGLMIAVSQE